MASFKKKNYSEPIISNCGMDLLQDWYVFFRFKHEGKVHKYKRREGINRIKNLGERLKAIDELCTEISFDLRHGWNPILDPKRAIDYNPYLNHTLGKEKRKPTKQQEHKQLFEKYYRKETK